jgi:hypothetical protein
VCVFQFLDSNGVISVHPEQAAPPPLSCVGLGQNLLCDREGGCSPLRMDTCKKPGRKGPKRLVSREPGFAVGLDSQARRRLSFGCPCSWASRNIGKEGNPWIPKEFFQCNLPCFMGSEMYIWHLLLRCEIRMITLLCDKLDRLGNVRRGKRLTTRDHVGVRLVGHARIL